MKFLPIYFLFLLIIFCGIFFRTIGGKDDHDQGQLAFELLDDPVIEEEFSTQKYLNKDIKCEYFNEEGQYEKPVIRFGEQFSKDYKCLSKFHRENFGPVCGDQDYPYAKHCAMVHFFRNKKINESDVFGDRKDKALALIDGCVICEDGGKNANELKMELAVTFEWPKESSSVTCIGKQIPSGKIAISEFQKVNHTRLFPKQGYSADSYGTSFVLPAEFQQRICRGILNEDNPPVILYSNIKLIVTHNCGSGGKFTVNLPDIEPEKYKWHIVEMRGLRLDLMKSEAKLINTDSKQYEHKLEWGNWFSANN